jgi:DNA-binding NarL/FixJ family response regulator
VRPDRRSGPTTGVSHDAALAAPLIGEQTFFAFNVLEARVRYELLRGEFDAAEQYLAAADAMAARVGDPMWTGPVAALRAELALWRGQRQEAAEIVRAALAVEPERQCLQHTSELHAVGARAFAELAVAARARHQDSAAGAQAAALLAGLERRLTSAFPLGAAPPRVSADVALCRAEVRRAFGDSDHDTWAAAVTDADAAGYSTRSVYARWRLTEALLERSIRDRAEAALREAAHRAAAIEHEPMTREIADLARRARISLTTDPGPSAPAYFGLTPRETEVLGLLAGGLTNKQIAATLYITDKTAEHHVSRILGKLGVSTRTAAGSLAHQLGIRQTDGGSKSACRAGVAVPPP